MTTDEQSNMKEPQIVSKETVEKAIEKLTEAHALVESFKEPALTDEQLDSAIDAALESPEVSAMLENAAADAADDSKLAQGQPKIYLTASGGSDYLQILRNDFEEFKKRVEKAFKHAGFKF